MEDPPPAYRSPRRSRLNAYCLQYICCAIGLWVIIANLLLLHFFPTPEPPFDAQV